MNLSYLEEQIETINTHQLTTLNLYNFSIGRGYFLDEDGGVKRQTEAIEIIVNAVKRCPTVHTLNLNSNEIDAVGGKVLAEKLLEIPQITTLDIGCNSLMGEGCLAIVQVPTLERLNLKGNSFGGRGDREIFEHLSNNLIEFHPPYTNYSRIAQAKIQANIEAKKQTASTLHAEKPSSTSELGMFAHPNTTRNESEPQMQASIQTTMASSRQK